MELYLYSPSTISWREHEQLYVLETEDILPCDILASHSGVGEDSSLLGCYTMQTGKELPTFRKLLLLQIISNYLTIYVA